MLLIFSEFQLHTAHETGFRRKSLLGKRKQQKHCWNTDDLETSTLLHANMKHWYYPLSLCSYQNVSTESIYLWCTPWAQLSWGHSVRSTTTESWFYSTQKQLWFALHRCRAQCDMIVWAILITLIQGQIIYG